MAIFETTPGSAHPPGTTTYPDGVNFSLFSRAATGVLLLLFDDLAATEPAQMIRFDPFQNKTFHFWHVFVRGCGPGIFYAFRMDGPSDPAAGQRFNPNKVLIGPYARGISRQLWKRADAVGSRDNLATSMRCAVVDPSGYDWEGDQPLKRPIHESIIYEMHVGGFTRSPSAGVTHPERSPALIEKIPYLQALGITAVELLPVFEFDDTDQALNPAGGVHSQLLGLQHGRVLQSALQLLRRSDRPLESQRVQRSGQGAASSGHRGDSGRRVQPYRRGQRAQADRVVPWHRQSNVLPARSAQPGGAMPTTAAWAIR